METRNKGTVILRFRGCNYKVTSARTQGGGNWTFECLDLDTKQHTTLNRNLTGFLRFL